MISKDQLPRPRCIHCDRLADITDGGEIYPHRPDLASQSFYICRPCDAYVGCHKGTTNPLGTPANAKLRRLRIAVHNLLDPMWQQVQDKRERKRARGDVYFRLAEEMQLSMNNCHVSLFNEKQCQQAYAILSRWKNDEELRKAS